MTSRQALISLARYLRQQKPLDKHVRLHLQNVPGNDPNVAGKAKLYLNDYHIYIDTNRDIAFQLDTLLHEWAHLVVGWKRAEHPQKFWIQYGKLYDIYLAWLDKNKGKI